MLTAVRNYDDVMYHQNKVLPGVTSIGVFQREEPRHSQKDGVQWLKNQARQRTTGTH